MMLLYSGENDTMMDANIMLYRYIIYIRKTGIEGTRLSSEISHQRTVLTSSVGRALG